jgi:hypothetical protein
MDWKLGQMQETLDPGLVLKGEAGTFRVTGPGGEVNRYECKEGYSIKSIRFLELVEPRPNNYFLIEKIGEPVTGAIESPPTALRHKTARA